MSAPESSRARQQAAEEAPSDEAPPPQRRWVVLSSIPHDDGPRRGAPRQIIPPGRDILLDLHDPPRPSTLVLRANLTLRGRTPMFTVIDVADSDSHRLFIRVVYGSIRENLPEYFLCDAAARTATRLPDPPPNVAGYGFCPNRTIGLIADPDHRGHFTVAQLHPIPDTRYRLILFYSTATRQWGIKRLASAPEHKCWVGHGVLAHDGLLWSVDIAYGMLVCNPFRDRPRLRLVPLPAPCALQLEGVETEATWRRTCYLLDQRRCIRASEGKLRYVEIHGFCYDTREAAAEPPTNPAVWVWTLVDPDRPDPWELEYEAPFAEIWAHDSYVDAGLPPGEVPNVAFIDPNNHGVVYFFQGSRLFGLDVRDRRVVACGECIIDDDRQQLRLQSSAFVYAWVPPPGDHPSDDANQQILSRDEEEDRKVIEYVDDWLNHELGDFVDEFLNSQADEDESNSSGEPVEDNSPPSESSPDAAHQADEPQI